MASESDIIKSYNEKLESYNSKYGVGFFTHIHTGIYKKEEFPFVSSGFDILNLGQDKLRHLLHAGQEILSNMVLRAGGADHGKDLKILDCGAGHGGTALYAAINYGAHVTAVTISPDQAEQIKYNFRKAGIENKLTLIIGDIRKHETTIPQGKFDIAIGIDAFCQIGNPKLLYGKLSQSLSVGGKLVVSDYFVQDKNSKIIEYFNEYWSSAITSLDETLSGAQGADLRLMKIDDLTEIQIPFWNLSICHSRALLADKTSEQERGRIENSIRFHNAMRASFESDELGYIILVFQRSKGAF